MAWASEAAEAAGAAILEVADAVRRWKAERQLSVGAPVTTVRLSCPSHLHGALTGALLDLRSVTRAAHIELQEGASLEVTVLAQETPTATGAPG